MRKMNIKNSRTIFIVLIILIVALILVKNPITDTDDDLKYKMAFHDIESFLSWSNEFFNVWGGRIIALGLTTIFLNANPCVFIIGSALIILVLVFSVSKIIQISDKQEFSNKTDMLLIASITIFLCISKDIISETTIWLTGAFNYLWPCVALIVGILPFIKLYNNKKIETWKYLIYFISSIFACNIEQTGAIFVVFCGIILILSKIEKIKIPKLIILNYIISVIVFSVSILAQGNNARYITELLRYYQDFDMLSLFDKLFLGINTTLNHAINRNIIMTLTMSILLSRIAFSDNNKNRKILSVISVCYGILRILTLNTESKLGESLFTFYKSIELTINNPYLYVSTILGVFVLLLMGILIFSSYTDYKKSIVYTLIYFAGICSSLALSISPTIYASGVRIYFVNDIMNLIVTISLINEVYNKDQKFDFNLILLLIMRLD